MLSGFEIAHPAAMCPGPRKGAFLVGANQPAVVRDIDGKDCGQPAFDRSPAKAMLLTARTKMD